MGRHEIPIDPDTGPIQRFAYELRKLRQEAGGPTYRAMARGVPYTAVTLSRAAAGEQLPSLEVTLAYVEACGGDPGEWERRWHGAAEEIAEQVPAADAGESPYQGLARFEPADHDRFFGRGRLITAVTELARGNRFAAVFGPSGSGKSSLLRAGLVPALRKDGRGLAAIRILTPGEHPLRTHATALTPKETGTDGTPQGDTLLLVDQFEEVFTLCTDPTERAAFIDRLLTAQNPDSRLRVIIAVRADFYSRCAEHRDLADTISDAALLVGPMTPAELRETIVGPAQGAGLIVEREVTARLISEVEGEPGGLPLLSHVLRETWRRRRGRTLTMAAYEGAGGTHGAIARTAEEAFADFSNERQHLARLILLRLITPGDGSQDTRRPVTRSELDFADRAEVLLVVDRLAHARLLTLDDDTIDLAHEALITAWPRLNAWIDEGRERMRAHRRLTEAAQAWHSQDRDPGALYRGTRLTSAEGHFTNPGHRVALTPVELSFLTASRTALTSERRRRHILFASLATVIVLALVAGVMAWRQSRANDRDQMQADAGLAAALATSSRATNPTLAMGTALAAWHRADTPESRAALMTAMTQKEHDSYTDEDPDPTAKRYLSDDGRTLLTVGEQRMVVTDVRTSQQTGTFPGLGRNLIPQSISSDLRRITVRQGDRLKVRDVRTGRVRDVTAVGEMHDISPSGRTLALYHSDSRGTAIRLKDVQTGRVLLRHSVESSFPPRAMVSPDDRLVALCVPGALLEVWDISRNRRLPGLRTPVAAGSDCVDKKVRFSPDSRLLVLVEDTGVRTWDLSSRKQLPKISHRRLAHVTFSADGTYLTATDGSEILFWRVGDPPALLFRYTLPEGSATELRIDLEERRIRYFASATGNVVRSLTLEGSLPRHWHSRPAAAATFSRDGSKLAIARMDNDTGRIRTRLVDSRNGRHLADLPDMACPPSSGKLPPKTACRPMLAFSPDGHALAYGVGDTRHPARLQRLFVKDTETGRTIILPVGSAGTANPSSHDVVHSIAFNADGTALLAHRVSFHSRFETWDLRKRALARGEAGADDGPIPQHDGNLLAPSSSALPDRADHRATHARIDRTSVESDLVLLWNEDARRILNKPLFSTAGKTSTHSVRAVALAPDRHMLAVAHDDGLLQLWDTDTGQLVPSLPTAGGATISLAFSPDGTTLYAASEHAPPHAYNITTQHAVARVEARLEEANLLSAD